MILMQSIAIANSFYSYVMSLKFPANEYLVRSKVTMIYSSIKILVIGIRLYSLILVYAVISAFLYYLAKY